MPRATTALAVHDLIPDWPSFLRDYWGQRVFSRALSPELLERLQEGFKDGDTAELLGTCRKADNTRYTPEERDEMERDLESNARTLNLPYCFCRGARELEAAFVDACAGHVNDIEVGLYISRAGGDVAEWHCDAVHNFTIQLRGSKEWQHRPATAPAAADVTSRGLLDAARNRAEQVAAEASGPIMAPGLAAAERFNLVAGSLLYLPPGDWHRVTPVAGHSLSVDVRLGHLSAGKWLCEALYASLGASLGASDRGFQSEQQPGGAGFAAGAGLLPIGPALTPDVAAAVGDLSASELLRDLLLTCPVPRPLPCEPSHSDGMSRGASIEWLEARNCLAPRAALHATNELVVSRLVPITALQPSASS